MAKKLLVVEDNESTLMMLKELLSEHGFIVSGAQTGEEGLELARKEQPDIVVTDTILPKMNGFEVCKAIKAIYPDCKVVITTAVIDAVDAGKAREAGSDEYCVKTMDFDSLLSKVKRALGESE